MVDNVQNTQWDPGDYLFEQGGGRDILCCCF